MAASLPNRWLIAIAGVVMQIALGAVYAWSVFLVKWFPDKRGLITGIAVTGFGGGALMTAPVATQLIASVGALETVAILGVVYCVAITGSAMFLRNPPPGYQPDGWAPSASQQQQRTAEPYSLGAALRSWQWSGLWMLLFSNTTAGIAIISQAAPTAQEIIGGTAAQAANLVGIMAIANGAGRLVWAWPSDFIGRRAIFLLMFPLQAIAFWLLPSVQSFGAFTMLVVLVLLCYGGGFGTMPAFGADYFGAENVGSIYGLMLTAWSVAGALGPTLIAAIRESRGGYNAALYLLAGLMLASALIPAIVRPPSTRRAGIGITPAPA